MNVSQLTQTSVPMNVDCQVVNNHLLACLAGHRGPIAGDDGQSVDAREAQVCAEVDVCRSVEGQCEALESQLGVLGIVG